MRLSGGRRGRPEDHDVVLQLAAVVLAQGGVVHEVHRAPPVFVGHGTDDCAVLRLNPVELAEEHVELNDQLIERLRHPTPSPGAELRHRRRPQGRPHKAWRCRLHRRLCPGPVRASDLHDLVHTSVGSRRRQSVARGRSGFEVTV